MPEIISAEQFESKYQELLERYKDLRKKFPDDIRFKKLGHVLRQSRSAHTRDRLYVVKYLNFFESKQIFFREERRAWVVRIFELLQKVILHKKLNKLP